METTGFEVGMLMAMVGTGVTGMVGVLGQGRGGRGRQNGSGDKG